MKRQQVTLTNPAGLHARPGKQLVQLSNQFEAQVTLIKDDSRFNGKSLMKLLQAGLSQGDTITVEIDGADEDAALEAITAYIDELEE